MPHRAPTRGFWPFVLSSLVVLVAFRTPTFPSPPSPERFMTHVRVLASDAMKGRGNGTPELDRAADYLAAQFSAAGLAPGGDNGSFFQPFPVTMNATTGPSNALRIGATSGTAGADFMTLPVSASGSYEGPIVFAGYGITAPDLGWDDYAGIDVTGQAVLVFSHDPWEGLPATSAVGLRSSFETKIRNARRHGARAILFVIDPVNHERTEELTLLDSHHLSPQDMGVLAMFVARRVVEPLFEPTGRTMRAIQIGLDTTLRPGSFALTGGAIEVTTDIRRLTRTVRNVVATLAGSDPTLRDEWVVLGAHYDHLGVALTYPPTAGGPEIHYGADDNASGTAGLLELGHVLQQHRRSLKRSVLLVAFAAEELGLVGSTHFVDVARKPPGAIVAMLNLDMIGRLDEGPVNILGSGLPPDLATWIREENQRVGLSLAFSDGASTASDWAAFQAIGIPALSFFTGTHRDYHQPSDTADRINAVDAVRILSVVAATTRRIAGATAVPKLAVGPALHDSDDPDFGAEPVVRPGSRAIRFEHVRHDSPAALAGLRAGDILVEFGEGPVRHPGDFRSALQSLRPGDMVAVVVRRAGRLVRVIVTLQATRLMSLDSASPRGASSGNHLH